MEKVDHHIYTESKSHSVMSDSFRPHGLYSPWNSPGQNTGVGSCSLLSGIFPTQGLNSGLLHCRQIHYQLSHQESPLPCVKQIAGRKLLHKTRSSAWHSVMTWGGRERWGQRRDAQEEGDICIIMTDCIVVRQKPTQHCKAIFCQSKIS